jgi:hypothetical protein
VLTGAKDAIAKADPQVTAEVFVHVEAEFSLYEM